MVHLGASRLTNVKISSSENFADITKEEAFEKTVELAFENLLGKEKDIDSMSEDEIRSAVRMYFSRVDLMPGSPSDRA